MKRMSWKGMLASAPPAGRILVVDDDPNVRKALSRLLARGGYSVQAVASSEEADRWLGVERFPVCLLDVELPRMSGVEFLTWALVKDPEMAVIMLTGVDAPEVALECLDQGARTFLVKPVEADFLLRAIRDAVALRYLLIEHNDRAGRTDSTEGSPWHAPS